MANTLKVTTWLPGTNFCTLSHLNGSLTTLVKKHRLKNNEAIVVTSKGWHRLRLIARIGDRACMLMPESTNTPLVTLVDWVQKSLQGNITSLNDWQALVSETMPAARVATA